jgi:CheY-like chemotaxis protein
MESRQPVEATPGVPTVSSNDPKPLVLLVEPTDARNQPHSKFLARAGFRLSSVQTDEVDVARVLEQRPAVIAAELDSSGLVTALSLAKRFRQDPEARLIPFIIYGHHLRPQDIEDVARAGALWLQLEPSDGARLVAAVRGLLAASRNERVEADATPR